MFGEDESSFGYIDPLVAKQRREILNPLFSRRAIIKLENVVQRKVRRLRLLRVDRTLTTTPGRQVHISSHIPS